MVNWNYSFPRQFSNAKHFMRQAGLLRNPGEKDSSFICSEMPNTVLPSGCSLSLFSGFGGESWGFFVGFLFLLAFFLFICWLVLGFFLKVCPSQGELEMHLVRLKGLPKSVFNRCGF